MTAEYQSSALVTILLVIGAIQMTKINEVVIKLCNLFWKRVMFSSCPNCIYYAMCISNNAGTYQTSSMEVDDKIPTNCKKQDQGHRLLPVEISHRIRSSSLKYMLSLYNSKNIYKQTSVCSPKPELYPSSSA